MKKTTQAFIYSFFVLTALFPAGRLLCALAGYQFLLFSNTGFAILLGLLSVSAAICSCVCKPEFGKSVGVIAAILPILSLINGLFLIFAGIQALGILCLLIAFVCSCTLAIKCTTNLVLRNVTLVIAGVLLIPAGFLGFMMLLFGSIGQNTVVKTVASPSETYYAQVIDSDQGALGGDTLVDVYEHKKLNAILFTIQKKPQRVYSGDWRAYENMQIYWSSDYCLVINGSENRIK